MSTSPPAGARRAGRRARPGTGHRPEAAADTGAAPAPTGPEGSRPPALPAARGPPSRGRRPRPGRCQPGTGAVTVVAARAAPPAAPLRWPALVLLALLLVGAGRAAGKSVADRMPTHVRRARRRLYPLVQEQPTGFLRQDRNLSTQEVLIASRTVLDPVAVQFGIAVEDLRGRTCRPRSWTRARSSGVQFTDPSRAQARKVLARDRHAVPASLEQPRAHRAAGLPRRPARRRAGPPRDGPRRGGRVGDLGLTQAAQAQVDALVTREAALQAQIDAEQLAAIAGPAPQVIGAAVRGARGGQPENRCSPPRAGRWPALVVALIVVAVIARRMTRP